MRCECATATKRASELETSRCRDSELEMGLRRTAATSLRDAEMQFQRKTDGEGERFERLTV